MCWFFLVLRTPIVIVIAFFAVPQVVEQPLFLLWFFLVFSSSECHTPQGSHLPFPEGHECRYRLTSKFLEISTRKYTSMIFLNNLFTLFTRGSNHGISLPRISFAITPQNSTLLLYTNNNSTQRNVAKGLMIARLDAPSSCTEIDVAKMLMIARRAAPSSRTETDHCSVRAPLSRRIQGRLDLWLGSPLGVRHSKYSIPS